MKTVLCGGFLFIFVVSNLKLKDYEKVINITVYSGINLGV